MGETPECLIVSTCHHFIYPTHYPDGNTESPKGKGYGQGPTTRKRTCRERAPVAVMAFRDSRAGLKGRKRERDVTEGWEPVILGRV